MNNMCWFAKRTPSVYLLIFFIVTVNSSSCPYYYLQQPPENPFCDPFGAFDLELKCKVCAELATDFSVGWQRDNESLTQDMAIIDNSQAVSNDSSGNVVQCVESRLKIRGAFLSKHYGNYFCRIVQGVHHRNLQPSRSIQLTSAAGQRCVSGMTFVDNLYSCAVITSPSTVDASVTNRTPASSGVPTSSPEPSALPTPILAAGQMTVSPEAPAVTIPNSTSGLSPPTLIMLIGVLVSIMGVATL